MNTMTTPRTTLRYEISLSTTVRNIHYGTKYRYLLRYIRDFLSDVHFSDLVTLRNVRWTYCACAMIGQYGAVVWCECRMALCALSANGASNPLPLLCLQFPSLYDSFLVLSLSLPLLSSLFVLRGSSGLTPQSSG